MILRFGLVVLCVCAMMGVAPDSGVQNDPPAAIEVPDLASMQHVRVLGVIDGDSLTLDIKGKPTRFELLAANAPEYIDHDPTPRLHAREAWFALHSLLEGEWVYIQRDPRRPKDTAGRLTGFLFRSPDMLFVNQEMVRQGYAEHVPKRSTMHSETIAWWQQHAKDAEKGIWSEEPIVLVEPDPEPAEPAPTRDLAPATLAPVPVAPASPASNEHFVYLTKSGSKYHTKDCRYYSASCRRVKVSDARKEHGACKVCKPDKRDD